MNRMPNDLIDAMAFAATDRGGSVTMLMGDNEIARLVLAWRNMTERGSHLVEDAHAAALHAITTERPDMPAAERAALAAAVVDCQRARDLID